MCLVFRNGKDAHVGFEEPGIIFFFTRNLEKKRGEIVGVYGNAKILKSERHTKWENLKRVTGIRQ